MKFKKEKDPFAALSNDFKDAVASMGQDELKTRFVETTKAELENQAAAKADQDLSRAKEQARVAAQPYSEQTKLNRLKTRFLVRAMADHGDAKSEQIIRLELSSVK